MRSKMKSKAAKEISSAELVAVGQMPALEPRENRSKKLDNWREAQKQVNFTMNINC